MLNTSGKRPFMNRVLIQVHVEPEKTEGGIIIPEDIKKKADQRSEWGTLVAIGADAWANSDDKCEIGDKVEFSKYGGKYDIGIDGLAYRMIDSHDILSVKIGIDK